MHHSTAEKVKSNLFDLTVGHCQYYLLAYEPKYLHISTGDDARCFK